MNPSTLKKKPVYPKLQRRNITELKPLAQPAKQTKTKKGSRMISTDLNKLAQLKPGSRQDENPLYASLLNEEYDVDHQGYLGPWVKARNRPGTRMSHLGNRRGQGSKEFKRHSIRPFENLRTDRPKLHLAIETERKPVRIDRLHEPNSRHLKHHIRNAPAREQFLRRQRARSRLDLEPSFLRLQPYRNSEVLFSYRSTWLGESKPTLLEEMAVADSQLDKRNRLRELMERGTNKQGTPRSNNRMLNLSQRLRTNTSSEGRDPEYMRSTVLTGFKATMFGWNSQTKPEAMHRRTLSLASGMHWNRGSFTIKRLNPTEKIWSRAGSNPALAFRKKVQRHQQPHP